MHIEIPDRAATRHAGLHAGTHDVQRLFEILRDSMELALSSAVEETAHSRHDLALECYHQLGTLGLPESISAQLEEFVGDLVRRFPTAWRVNAAVRACERAAEARRAPTQLTRLAEARDILVGGLEAPGVDRNELEALLVEVDRQRSRIESSAVGAGASIEEPVGLPAGEPAGDPVELVPIAVSNARGEAPVEALVARVESVLDAEGIGAGADAAAAKAGPSPRPAASGGKMTVEVSLGVLAHVHLATLRGRGGPVHTLAIRTGPGETIDGLELELSAQPPFFAPSRVKLDGLVGGDGVDLGPRRIASFLRYDHGVLAHLTERAEGHVTARVVDSEGTVHAQAESPWTLFPPDAWSGVNSLPELLAAYVLPNDPAVDALLARAAQRLSGAGLDPSLDGYQAKDPRRVLDVVEGVYGALQDVGITYANPPASFDTDGQRVRFPSKVSTSKIATCLDMALFAGAALEQAGLHPVLVIVEGHAFVAVWLVERTFANPVLDDVSRLSKRVELTELVVLDPTLATSRPSPDFPGARQAAEDRLMESATFRLAVDVRRARLGGVLPIPTDASGFDAWSDGVRRMDADATPSVRDLDAELEEYLAAERRRRAEEETPATRLDRWLRQLLDLTMRNRLLNASARAKRVVPILGSDLGPVEDRLADGKSFRILERPVELDALSGADSLEPIDRVAPLLAAGVQSGELRSSLKAADLTERLVQLYRDARTAQEEGGANSLYLAVGFLRYREAKQSTKLRRAPLLLIPVELRRKSARRGYTLVQGGDEPRFNVTLLEYLRRDHEIDITGLETLPSDDKGIDVPLVLRIVRDAIKDEDGWEVDPEAEVGLYSFSKYLLWRDLRDRSDVLRENALVAHLLDRPTEAFPQSAPLPDPRELDQRYQAAEVFAPLSYDSSQLSAILAAAEGRTMVLEGPPGTGKSQTITNLVAHAIAQGQTVLFVSEKMAALEVVQRRLEAIGLGPACLELHSNKAHKKGVLGQFKEALDEGRVQGRKRRDWADVSSDVSAARARLNGHVQAMHGGTSSGESVHEVLARRAGIALDGLAEGAAPGDLTEGDVPVLKDPLAADEGTLEAMRSALDEVDRLSSREAVGPDHPLLGVGRTDYSPIIEREMLAHLRAYDAPAAEFVASARDVLAGLGIAEDDAMSPGDAAGWDALRALGAALLQPPRFGPGLGEALAAGGLVDGAPVSRALAIVDKAEELRELEAGFAAKFRVPPTDLDLKALEGVRREMVGGGFFTRWRRKGALRAAFRGIANEPGRIGIDEAIAALEGAQRAKSLGDEVSAGGDALRALVPAAWPETGGDVAAARADLARAGAIGGRVAELAGATSASTAQVVEHTVRILDEKHDDLAAVEGSLSRRLRALGDAQAQEAAAWSRVEEAAAPHWSEPVSIAGVESRARTVLGWADGWRQLLPWTRWQGARGAAVRVELAGVVEAIETGRLAPGSARRAFDGAFDAAWALHRISEDEHLRAFDGSEHGRAITAFGELDDERLRSAREEVRKLVGGKRPKLSETREPAKDSALGFLQREITKKTRHVAIRRLLGELGELGRELKPCFLMSPMSVAQYLEPDAAPFDLVVFDEASQIAVWDAIGSIARGRQAVIVGDPKQLPPTSFFSRGEGEDIEEDDVQDLESILEECIGAQVPTHSLKWHYRSRHESLIAFSNERYYGGGLHTFPSNASAGLGVSARLIEGAVYDKGATRTNRIEARAAVDEVVRRLLDPGHKERSIGVVTFSQAQQTLVMDMLDEAQREHPEIEPFFDESQPEPVFVKNLENVQGDERDVILFSIGYGPDERGRVSMNFGPLNKDGGERRLNVAVTRAREEVCVFASLRSDQIDLARTSAQGVRDLRAFLRHAEIASGAEAAQARPAPDGLVASLAEALTSRGWEVRLDVGASDVRVDLAVVDPRVAGRFLAGIETDGQNYARAATTRDRDRLRGDVLRGLGWTLIPVWTVDWWRDSEAEIARLHGRLEDLLSRDVPSDDATPRSVLGVAPGLALPPAEVLDEENGSSGPGH